jgi:hypothetical protein
MSRKSVIALVLAPTIVLATQSTLYSMVTPACSSQTRLELHLAAAVALVVVLVMAVLAFGESSLRRGEPGSHDSDEAHAPVPGRFLANCACAVAALSALVIVGMWFALWVLTPCLP